MPQLLYPQERGPGIHWTRGWVGLRASLDAVVREKKKTLHCPCWESNPSHIACSLVTILTEQPQLLRCSSIEFHQHLLIFFWGPTSEFHIEQPSKLYTRIKFHENLFIQRGVSSIQMGRGSKLLSSNFKLQENPKNVFKMFTYLISNIHNLKPKCNLAVNTGWHH
jgi:hypothetical protein